MAFRTLNIGRRSDAHIRLTDNSVSRLHAELTVTSEGRYYLTDRGSLRGTWVFRHGEWKAHRQGYVEPHEELRFGRQKTRIGSLLKGKSIDFESDRPHRETASIRPRRNPETGEIEV